MTKLGLFLSQKSINKADVARKTGISKARLNQLTMHASTHLRAKELYLIANAIQVRPEEILDALYAKK